MRNFSRFVLLAAAALPVFVILLGVVVAVSLSNRLLPAGARSGMLEQPYPAADFSLVRAGNSPLSLADLRGNVTLLFFGYTNCPDVCPLTLSTIARAKEQLSATEASKVQTVFVTIDPDRDTPEHLRAYVEQFDRSFIGAVAPGEELPALTAKYFVAYEREPGPTPDQYFFDHSAFTTVIDGDGVVRAIVPTEDDAEQYASVIRAVLAPD
jgi:protein SCO1/2